MANQERDIQSIEQELQKFPPVVIDEFRKAMPLAEAGLSAADMLAWAGEGVAIACSGLDCWQAAAGYFRVTPRALVSPGSPQLLNWARRGRMLAGESAGLATAYFQASLAALEYLTVAQLEQWVEMGKSLCKGTRQSVSLACRFFQVSPGLFRYLNLDEVGYFLKFINCLAPKCHESASECLDSAAEVFLPLEEPDRKSFLALAMLFAGNNWNDAKLYFISGPKFLARIERAERARFLSLAERINHRNGHHTLPFIIAGSEALGELPDTIHRRLLILTEELLALSGFAATEFLKSCPGVLRRVGLPGLEHWFREGVQTLQNGEEGGIAYFRTELKRSSMLLEQLYCGVELAQVKEVFTRYGKALTDRDITLHAADNLEENRWASLEKLAAEGATVFLPGLMEKYPTKKENFTWYKVAVTHQAGHLEFGSFDFCFAREASLFRDRRFHLARQVTVRDGVADLLRFFDLFHDRDLATDVFTVVEDSRVDYLVNLEYQGIGRDYKKIQKDALSERPPLASLPSRELLLEILARLGLGSSRDFLVPSVLHVPLRRASLILGRVQSPGAKVEDSAEATIRLYQILHQIPNEPISGDDWGAIDLERDFDGSDTPFSDDNFPFQDNSPGKSAGALPYTRLQKVEFRGEFEPEMVQWLVKLKSKSQKEPEEESLSVPVPVSEHFEGNSEEFELNELFGGQPTTPQGLFVSALKPAGRQTESAAQNQEKNKGGDGNREEALQDDDYPAFFYDEWDFRANDYKPRWCRLRQRLMAEGVPDFFEATLNDYVGLVARIRKEFERLNPQFFRKVRRLDDGQEFDMDAVVNYVVERRAGQRPDDKVYWRRNKTERDVAVVFLLDMSSSTIEYIDERQGGSDRLYYAKDYKGYLEWLQYHQDGQGRPRAFKRIIDLEKESVVLLVKALETIGDIYAIYGFSGSGRENVEFYVIKDLEEGFSDKIKRRIDSISPLNGTRMGPALRHATWKLEQQPSRSKFLFLISDGRPQDHGYGKDGLEKEYAINDTKMAFVEAMRKNITPFCLTVDRGGHDYLRTMCRDMGYEVVADIESLPERLPALYRKLTV